MEDIDDWWAKTIKQNMNEGFADADKGIFEPPYPGSEDPGDQEENWAYKKGFDARRLELGDRFKWA